MRPRRAGAEGEAGPRAQASRSAAPSAQGSRSYLLCKKAAVRVPWCPLVSPRATWWCRLTLRLRGSGHRRPRFPPGSQLSGRGSRRHTKGPRPTALLMAQAPGSPHQVTRTCRVPRRAAVPVSEDVTVPHPGDSRQVPARKGSVSRCGAGGSWIHLEVENPTRYKCTYFE